MGVSRERDDTTTQTQPPTLAGILATIYGPRPPEFPERAAAGLAEIMAEADELSAAVDGSRSALLGAVFRTARHHAPLVAAALDDVRQAALDDGSGLAAALYVDELHSAARTRDGEARDLRAKAANLDMLRTMLDRRDVVALAAAAGGVA